MSASRISVYSLTDLKATLDDHVPLFLTSPNTTSSKPLARSQLFTQSHTTTYIRLGLGYSAVLVALYIFYLDYILKLDFADTKEVTVYAVIAYLVLNGAFTLWLWFGEKGLIFEGSRITGNKIDELKIWSSAPKTKYEPTYCFTADATASGAGSKRIERRVQFTEFFTKDGYFVPENFEEWLKKQLPLIAGTSRPAVDAVVKSPDPKTSAEDDTIVVGGTPKDSSGETFGGVYIDTPTKKRSKKRA